MRYLMLKWRHKFPNRLVNFDLGCIYLKDICKCKSDMTSNFAFIWGKEMRWISSESSLRTVLGAGAGRG